jgi:hypothetical protein
MLKEKFNLIMLFHIISMRYVRSSSEQVMIGSQILEVEMVECMLNSLPMRSNLLELLQYFESSNIS